MGKSKGSSMSKRRRARRIAVECLYQWDLGGLDIDAAVADYIPGRVADERIRREASALVTGTAARIADIDRRLGAVIRHWSEERLAAIDRTILRLGTYEILFREDVPAAAAINEAVELAKLLSSAESGGFVNGVLDEIRRLKETESAAGGAGPSRTE